MKRNLEEGSRGPDVRKKQKRNKVFIQILRTQNPTTCFPLFKSTGNVFCALPPTPTQRESGSRRHTSAHSSGGGGIAFPPLQHAGERDPSVQWGTCRGCCRVQFTGPRWRTFMVSYHKNARPAWVVLSSNRARLLAFALSGQLINLRRAAASLL